MAGTQGQYLRKRSFKALRAAAEVLVEGENEVLTAQQVAENADGYLASVRSSQKKKVRLALTVLYFLPLLRTGRTLPGLSPDRRRAYLEARFVAGIAKHKVRFLRIYAKAIIRAASQFSYLGYYGDERSWASIGFLRYRDRPGGRPPAPDDYPAPPVQVLPHARAASETVYDSIVVGSGAAGSILAYRLAEAGRHVLVVERGPHVDPRQFTDNEVAQYLKLYNEGAFQLANDFNFQVLQGMCVGGGTTVNNALCLAPPSPILDAWAERGLDKGAVERSIATVRQWLSVAPIREGATSLAAKRFADSARDLQLPGRIETMEANISQRCLGCGYCNAGCAYGAKLSMLDTVLPWGQQQFGDRLQVLPDFEISEIRYKNGRAQGVRGRAADSRNAVEIDARTDVILSAGAMHSSLLLSRSNIGDGRPGHGLYFNINSPMAAEYAEPVDSFAGIQMSHAYYPDGDVPPFLIETWFNPPATQSLTMPGWFSQHFRNMQRYRYMAGGGSLVGTICPGRVKRTRSGMKLVYKPAEADLRNVVAGMKLMARIFLHDEAIRVMPATHAWYAFENESDLDALDRFVDDSSDLLLTTAHPQGGNAIGAPSQGGVVDETFRVHGFDNLYVCDASVFPSSVHVNPQLTVMGLAQHAAELIVDGS